MDNTLAEKQELLDNIDYLEGSLGSSQAANEQSNKQVDELKVLVKEFNELTDEKSKIIDQREDQLAQNENINASIVSEKNKEISELKKQNLTDAIQLRDHLTTLMKENTRIILQNAEMMNELGEKSRVIEQLEDQLAKLKHENAKIISESNKEMTELNYEKSRAIEELVEQLAKLMRENSSLAIELSNMAYKNKKLTELQEQVESLRKHKKLILSQLDLVDHNLSYTDVEIEKLMKDLDRGMFEKDVLWMALGFSLKNCATNEKVHTRETRNLKNQPEEMTFLLNKTNSWSNVSGRKNQVRVCREKFLLCKYLYAFYQS